MYIFVLLKGSFYLTEVLDCGELVRVLNLIM